MSPKSVWGRGDQTIIPVQVPKYTQIEARVTSLSGCRVRSMALLEGFSSAFKGRLIFNQQCLSAVKSASHSPKFGIFNSTFFFSFECYLETR